MKKIGILFTSRNNYELLDLWMSKIDTEGFSVLNIDEDSTDENKQKGKEICKKYNITYMDREERGMLYNVVSACNYFKKQNLEWIVFITHDCFPTTPNFFSKFNKMISTGEYDEFGVIGFNILHDDSWHLLSRSPLQPGGMYDRYRKNQIIPEQYSKPYAIESAMWTIAAVKISQYKKYIIPTGDYHFFHTWDDIAFQFLYNNVYNVCIPLLEASHIQTVKEQFNIPVKSPHANNPEEEKKREFYFSKFTHHEIWNERWGFHWDDRNTFVEVKENYKNTLLYDFYSSPSERNVDGGIIPNPLQTFEI